MKRVRKIYRRRLGDELSKELRNLRNGMRGVRSKQLEKIIKSLERSIGKKKPERRRK